MRPLAMPEWFAHIVHEALADYHGAATRDVLARELWRGLNEQAKLRYVSLDNVLYHSNSKGIRDKRVLVLPTSDKETQ